MPINADKPHLWKNETLGPKVEPPARQQTLPCADLRRGTDNWTKG